jgi:uncharacterized membrane protein
MNQNPLIQNDAVVFGILMGLLALVFYSSKLENRFFKKIYSVVPALLLCYFIPALLNTFGVISGEKSGLYPMASRYLLPASLVLLTIGIDIKSLRRLGGKSIVIFFAGTLGVIIGGPIAMAITGLLFPDSLYFEGEETWRGLATIAGSWIGGGANQAAMLEVFGSGKSLFGQMIAVDVLIGNIWTGILLFGITRNKSINKWLRADDSSIVELEQRVEQMKLEQGEMKAGVSPWIQVLGIAFAFTAISHLGGDFLAPWFATNYPASASYSLTSSFFWIVIIATTLGMVASFTRLRKLEQSGASEIGTVFLYILVATIGMNMNLKALVNSPVFFLTGSIWMLIHITVLLIAARIIKAPYFFIAVGSQANIGGAASAPVVAGFFNKFLAPVGVLLAVLGYAVGTYGAYISGLLMQWVFQFLR